MISGRAPNTKNFEKKFVQVMLSGGPNTEKFEKKFYRQCKLAGPQHREFRKEILQVMQVGEGQE
ncbi:nitrogen fixation protein NifR [Staphylococcus aureus subsp. aureus]|nr:nitrogen fixation protein NifR [Staphylococcus aureus]